MKNTPTLALACALYLTLCAGSARAEAGFIKIDKTNLEQAERHGVVLKITKDERDLFHIDIRITPRNQKTSYTVDLLVGGGSWIRLQQRVYDGKIFSEHLLSKDLMSNGRIRVGGIAGHEMNSPDNLLLIDLNSFVQKD